MRVRVTDVTSIESEKQSTPATSTGNATNNSKSSKTKRVKHRCPYPTCSSNVIHLPRHMKQVHKWAKEDATSVVNTFALRKQRKGSQRKSLKQKICPVFGCKSVVRRLHNHLVDIHGHKRGSKTYKECLGAAIVNEVIELSSDSMSCESSSEEYTHISKLNSKKRVKKQVKKQKIVKGNHESIFKKVYSSSDDDDDEDEKDNGCPTCPSIFKQKNEGECSQTFTNANEVPREGEIAKSGDMVCKKDVMTHSQKDLSDKWSSEELESGEESDSDSSYTYSQESDDEEILNTPVNAAPDEASIFKQFEDWLQTADGGRKDETNALKCSRQVQLVMQYICPENPTLKDVLNKNTLKTKWLNKFEKERHPGTVRAYLGDLRQFYSFIQCELPRNVDVSSDVLYSLEAQMTQWSKSFYKLVKNRYWEKRMIDMEQLRTPDQIREFSLSSVARTAIKLLDEYQVKPEGTMPSQTEYTAVRDYLVTTICINNGSRSGALANITVSEFMSAQPLDDSCVV